MLDRAAHALGPALPPWEILVVDDESADGTAELVSEYAWTEPRVRLILRRGESGLAGAITYGWAQLDADLLGVIDADLQHPPELLAELLREIMGGADIAIASRYIQAHSMDTWSPVRRLISRVSSLASKTVDPKLKVTDPMSRFFVVRRESIDGIAVSTDGIQTSAGDSRQRPHPLGQENPYTFEFRRHGKSKANFMTAVHYFSLLWRLAFKRSREEHKSSCS